MSPGILSPVVAVVSPAQRSRLLRGKGTLLPSPLAHTNLTPRSAAPEEDGMAELRRKYPQQAGRPANEDGRFGVVYHARSRPGGVEVAIKRQPVAEGAQGDCAAYRELRILQHLNSRIADQRNFVFVLDWNKCWVSDEEEEDKKKTEEAVEAEETTDDSRQGRARQRPKKGGSRGRKESRGRAPARPSKGGAAREEEREDGALCMNLVLEAAGTSLRELLRGRELALDITAFRELLFQLLYALHQAQEECEFVHNDLHLGNVLLKRRQQAPRMLYRATAGAAAGWLVDGSRLAKIVDFGHSRISLPGGGSVANSRDPLRQGFLPGTDVAKLSMELKRLSLVSYVDAALAQAPEEVRQENERQNRAHKRQVMRRMTEACAPGLLLRLPFFDCLREGAACAGVEPSQAALYPYFSAEEEEERGRRTAVARTTALTPLHGKGRKKGNRRKRSASEKENTRAQKEDRRQSSDEKAATKEEDVEPLPRKARETAEVETRKAAKKAATKKERGPTMARATSAEVSSSTALATAEATGPRRSRRQAMQRSKSGGAADLAAVAGSLAALSVHDRK